MGLRRKIRMTEKTEKTVWELFDLFSTEKRNYGCEDKTIDNYEKSLKRFLNACLCEQDWFYQRDYKRDDYGLYRRAQGG